MLIYLGSILQDGKLDMGFKANRDQYYFTSHGNVVVDIYGVLGKRVGHKSCPYHAIKAIPCETAGGGFDSDSNLKVYGGIDLSIEIDKEN